MFVEVVLRGVGVARVAAPLGLFERQRRLSDTAQMAESRSAAPASAAASHRPGSATASAPLQKLEKPKSVAFA
ncbi:hypothetical protein E3G68_005193 [Mycobacteroides abscessus]|nr:hypothetical protein [Mycobacteroides abscessus]